MFKSFETLIEFNSSIKILNIGKIIIICTLAPNFKKKINQWKLSGIIDIDTKYYYFCQSDIFAMDNWTQYKNIRLGELFEIEFPNFKETLKSHLPDNKIYLVDDLYNINFTCCEIIFAIKEFIAWIHIFNLSEDKIKIVFNNIKTKYGNFPYMTNELTSYKDGIANYIETFIKFMDTCPIPIKLKLNGRTANAYGFFAFSTPETKIFLKENNIYIPNLEYELKTLLISLKILVINKNDDLKKLWKWLYDLNFEMSEISSDDKIWAKYYLVLDKKDECEVSVIGNILIKILNIEDHSCLNEWLENPFCSHLEVLMNTFKDKGFTAYLNELEHVKYGGNNLGIICKNAIDKIFKN